MPELAVPSLDELSRQEEELVLPRFDQRDAWRLGSRIAERALSESLGVAVDIRRHSLILFRASLPGSTSDQQEWIERKAALVLRMESSSLLLARRFDEQGFDPTDPQMGWLSAERYALAGGSFPIRVAGVGVVAAVTVSGLVSDEDHQLAVEGLRAHLGAL